MDPIETVQKAVDGIGEKLKTLDTLKADIQALEGKISHLEVGEPNVKDDPKCGFKHVGEYAQAVMKAGSPEFRFAEDERLKLITKAATGVSQTESSISVGYLFPPGFAAGLHESPYNTDDLIGRCKKVPIDASQESITFTYVDDADRSGGTVRGGISAKWKAETTQMTGTVPTLRQITLRPVELYAMAYATDKSLRNSPIALGAWLTSGMQEAVKFKIGDSVVNGNGVGQLLGLLNSPDKIEVAKETSQGADTINHVNIEKMWKRMPAWMRGNAIWLGNQDCEDQFSRMARSAIKNDGTALESADTVAAFNEEKNTLKGRPIVYTEYNPTVGDAGDLVLWAPQHYLVATKTGQGPEMSMHLKFDYAETAFRVIFEIDGRSEFPTVHTPYKGSVTRSAIVTLAARA